MSYSPFGPGGAQMFVTANIRGDRPARPHPGVHSGFNNAASGTLYPAALDRTGLAMLTMRVNDLAKCRAMCKAAGIAPVGEGALPLPGAASREGFCLRGAVGELIEVVSG